MSHPKNRPSGVVVLTTRTKREPRADQTLPRRKSSLHHPAHFLLLQPAPGDGPQPTTGICLLAPVRPPHAPRTPLLSRSAYPSLSRQWVGCRKPDGLRQAPRTSTHPSDAQRTVLAPEAPQPFPLVTPNAQRCVLTTRTKHGQHANRNLPRNSSAHRQPANSPPRRPVPGDGQPLTAHSPAARRSANRPLARRSQVASADPRSQLPTTPTNIGPPAAPAAPARPPPSAPRQPAPGDGPPPTGAHPLGRQPAHRPLARGLQVARADPRSQVRTTPTSSGRPAAPRAHTPAPRLTPQPGPTPPHADRPCPPKEQA